MTGMRTGIVISTELGLRVFMLHFRVEVVKSHLCYM